MASTTKTLRRIPERGQIAGVCAGLAEYFDIDVTLIRIAFVLLGVMTGGGFVIVYIVLALVIPSDDTKTKETGTKGLERNAQSLAAEMQELGRVNKLRDYFGFGLIVFGFWLLLSELYPNWIDFRWDYIWPIVLIVVGIYIATRKKV